MCCGHARPWQGLGIICRLTPHGRYLLKMTVLLREVSPIAPSPVGWRAHLALRFARAGERTRLVHKRHEGPLRVMKTLPRPDGGCEAVIVHPPGGLVAGDWLELEVVLDPGARVVCTTPGAQKWYRSERGAAYARTSLQVADAAVLEWLPQPAIVFDRAQVDQAVTIELAPEATMIGWECLVLGRAAMGERFTQGRLRQRMTLTRSGVPCWAESTVAEASDRLFMSPLGWGRRTVACTVWLAAPAAQIADPVRDAWRAVLAQRDICPAGRAARLSAGVSRVDAGLMAARILADDAEPVMQLAQQLWRCARLAVLGETTVAPRIWAT